MVAVGIIDYGMGNLGSIRRALEECGATASVVAAPADAAAFTHLILPGVGSFADGMRNLRDAGWDAALRAIVDTDRVPVLGICLGMQLLFAEGDEGGSCAGLGLLPGAVRRMVPADAERIPHVGWDDVACSAHPYWTGLAPRPDFYFVHSYHVVPADPAHVIARGDYAGGFVAAVARGLLAGVQFHPEKSQRNGFRVLRNFLAA